MEDLFKMYEIEFSEIDTAVTNEWWESLPLIEKKAAMGIYVSTKGAMIQMNPNWPYMESDDESDG